MTVVEPDPVPIIFAIAFHGIICVVTLRHLKIRIYHNLKHPQYKTQTAQNQFSSWETLCLDIRFGISNVSQFQTLPHDTAACETKTLLHMIYVMI